MTRPLKLSLLGVLWTVIGLVAVAGFHWGWGFAFTALGVGFTVTAVVLSSKEGWSRREPDEDCYEEGEHDGDW